MTVSPVMWIITLAILAGVLVFDILIIGRRPHIPSVKECLFFIGLYSALAVVFGLGIGLVYGSKNAGDFFAGWLTEYSLSVDNLFIFLLIMTRFKVPAKLQQFALMVGIVLALVFRGVFIALGAAVIHLFSGVFFLFGAFLLYTAAKLLWDYFHPDDEDDDAKPNWAIRQITQRVPSTPDFHGTSLLARIDGRRAMTPMLLVIVALGTTDLMFALDSIPAIYGLTQEPYLVFAATVFALMGLRQLYFLLGGMLKRLVYLSIGLSIILAFIGVKLVLEAMHAYHWDAAWGLNLEISTPVSLAVIIGTLVITTIASLIKSRHDDKAADDGDSAPPRPSERNSERSAASGQRRS